MRLCVSKRTELGLGVAEQLATLWEVLWPSGDSETIEERAAGLLAETLPEQRMALGSERFHMAMQGDEVVSVARTFVREIRFEETSRPYSILALASVGTVPRHQGVGYGKAVVQDAFARLSEEVPWCLFQTQVPPFYSKLGASQVGNVFFDSLAEDREARPWWDDHVMVFGDRRKWPAGRVDLCGVAY